MGLNKEQQLEMLLNQKKSKKYYSKRLGISEEEVEKLLNNIRRRSPDEEEANYNEDFEKQEIKVSKLWPYPPKPEDIIREHKIDQTKWKLSQVWIKQTAKGHLTSACFSPKIPTQISESEFAEIIKAVRPLPKKISQPPKEKHLKNAALILPKQDAHYDKFDVFGQNDINSRFTIIERATTNILKKATVSSNLEKIYYIIGSDQFNSEWTLATTKGTPQTNILSYHEAFEKIGEFEAGIIDYLAENTQNLEVIFVPGNHDHYVGWHLAHWLKALFKNRKNINFDTNPLNRKYEKYHSTAIMFNHGDELKARDLAHRFPMEFKKEWSSCENFLAFTGDKHFEQSQDIQGIKFYQVPALSSAKSNWDDKKGYTCTKAEMMGFLVTQDSGLTDIYKELL